MDMNPSLSEQVVFHLTGRRSEAKLEAIDDLDLRPAQFARFGDLTRLRYDYPLVLVESDASEDYLATLSGLIDKLLRDIAPRGLEGERLRKNVLRLEREIRVALAQGVPGRLTELWERVADALVAKGGEPMQADLARARAALRVDGLLVDCDGATATCVVEHAWRSIQQHKARQARRAIDELVFKLSDLIKADYLRSEAGRHADTLKAGIGSPHQALFDFDAMAQLLAKPSGGSALPAARRARIEAALAVLRSQLFFNGKDSYTYRFDDVGAALAAYSERLPAMAELVKAMAIAELETTGRYVEASHDAHFAGFDLQSLSARDRAFFPDYLVCVPARTAVAPLLDALASGAPLKVLFETAELLDSGSFGETHSSPAAQLASSAMGLNGVYALQSSTARLYCMREQLLAAMHYAGPALVSTFSGLGVHGLPSYLVSAAALQSRAFPAFSYDPSAGGDWARRFSLAGNPQSGEAWPVHEFSYADGDLQRIDAKLPFTLVDFALCDRRYAKHFARVPSGAGNGSMVPVGDWLARPANGVPETVPCVLAVDGESRVHRLIVDEKLVHAARLCAETWHRLQELDGLGTKAAPIVAESAKAEPVAMSAAPQPPEVASEPAAERKSDDPYIETERCTTCNECTQINAAMFAYNANKQASIVNPDAGTYRQLVEAAESCQVSIIHPGKPRNPKEPGLEELRKRAEPFL
ncbi:MAG: ferredoxin [Betaproteobacteria bacterium]|nr:ferredoxin [Betaproteobacteria bacterium]